MKIALFAAVPEEVGSWADHVNFTGIGRENATRTALSFMRHHAGEKITVVNFGTVGAHHLPVGTVLSINEITSAGRIFDPNPMLTDHFSVPSAQGLVEAFFGEEVLEHDLEIVVGDGLIERQSVVGHGGAKVVVEGEVGEGVEHADGGFAHTVAAVEEGVGLLEHAGCGARGGHELQQALAGRELVVAGNQVLAVGVGNFQDAVADGGCAF